MEKAKQTILQKAYTRYYLALLTYGSEQEIAEELGPDVLAIHKKGTEVRKNGLAKVREERMKQREVMREARQKEREERTKRLEEKKQLRVREKEAIALARNIPLSSIAFALNESVEEEEEGISDEE